MTASVLGIMQGRLSPPIGDRFQCFPRDTWETEIAVAPEAGLGGIEWIYDQYGAGANPIETEEGIGQVLDLSERHGVVVESICADWFMEELLVGGTEASRLAARERLIWLLGQAERLGVWRVVLPFVDASALSTEALLDQAVEAIETTLPTADAAGVELHLETSLGPEEFAGFLSRVSGPGVRVNYDTGNSSSLGYDPHEELAAYGERLGSVHIKDRVRGGATVPLGTGDADFDGVFSELERLHYGGPFVLQAARGEPGDELATTRSNVAFTRNFLAHLSGWEGVGQ